MADQNDRDEPKSSSTFMANLVDKNFGSFSLNKMFTKHEHAVQENTNAVYKKWIGKFIKVFEPGASSVAWTPFSWEQRR